MVLLDALVHDRRGRSVADLSPDDFILFVDGKQTEIATLDLRCPLGPSEDPRAGQKAAPAAGGGRRIVLAFDYYHMLSPVETLGKMRTSVAERHVAGDEFMVVSIGQTVRIEAPFTSDAAKILETLDRMESDLDLYGGAYDRLTEFRFFERLDALFDLLERVPGHKAVVLFSGPFEPDGFHHDTAYRRLAARAAAARVAIYPVDSSGLTAPTSFRYGDFGGPKKLARMATVTGGRMTYNTNDFGLGLARAQRDLGCTYTVGFYDRREKVDRVRRIGIFARRRGMRGIHPTAYIFRSDREKLRSFVTTAHMMPEIFESGDVRVELFPLYPRSPGKWSAVVSARIRGGHGEAGAGTEGWKLEGLVRKPSGTVVRRWERLVEPPSREITVSKSVTLKPGRYLLSVVLSAPGSDAPWASSAEVEMPEIPESVLFHIGPTLARRAPLDEAEGLPELLPSQARRIRRGEELTVMTRVCRSGGDVLLDGRTIERTLLTDDGRSIWNAEPVAVEIVAGGKVGCQLIVDLLPTSTLPPGEYRLAAGLLPAGEGAPGEGDSFTVVP
jgi:VWFA-related protein